MQTVASAHPVPFKDGTSITILSQTFQSDVNAFYSFSRIAAIGLRVVSFDSNDNYMQYVGSQLNFLYHRANGDGYQGNVYFSTGVGPMNYNGHEHSAIVTGVDTDLEDRRYYISFKAEKMWSGVGYDFWHLRSRLGIAPYEADFDQVATWFMVQYEYNRLIEGKDRVTTLVRFFYDTYLFEIGVSTRGEGMINLMSHF